MIIRLGTLANRVRVQLWREFMKLYLFTGHETGGTRWLESENVLECMQISKMGDESYVCWSNRPVNFVFKRDQINNALPFRKSVIIDNFLPIPRWTYCPRSSHSAVLLVVWLSFSVLEMIWLIFVSLFDPVSSRSCLLLLGLYFPFLLNIFLYNS